MYDKVIGEEVLRVVFLVREVAIGPVHSGPKWWSGRRPDGFGSRVWLELVWFWLEKGLGLNSFLPSSRSLYPSQRYSYFLSFSVSPVDMNLNTQVESEYTSRI